MKGTFTAILIAFLFSCQYEGNRTDLVSYYNLDALINQQISMLQDEKPSLSKVVILDGTKDSKQLSGNEIDWVQELDIFLEHDINAPALVGAFQVIELPDATRYMRRDSVSSGVQQFDVEYIPNTDLPSRIHTVTRSKNTLYTSHRKATLRFDNKDGDHRIIAYHVAGAQSILGQEPTVYTLDSEITY